MELICFVKSVRLLETVERFRFENSNGETIEGYVRREVQQWKRQFMAADAEVDDATSDFSSLQLRVRFVSSRRRRSSLNIVVYIFQTGGQQMHTSPGITDAAQDDDDGPERGTSPLIRRVRRGRKATGEMLFKCRKTPGCTRDFSTPQGLKYHHDKGTCDPPLAPAATPSTIADDGNEGH